MPTRRLNIGSSWALQVGAMRNTHARSPTEIVRISVSSSPLGPCLALRALPSISSPMANSGYTARWNASAREGKGAVRATCSYQTYNPSAKAQVAVAPAKKYQGVAWFGRFLRTPIRIAPALEAPTRQYRRSRPNHATPWYFFAGATATWAFADGLYVWYEHVALTAPFPSLADAFHP